MLFSLLIFGAAASCGASGNATKSGETASADTKTESAAPVFDADSAYAYVKKQVDFGPRVPNTEAHRRAADWMAAELRRRGADVTEQKMQLRAFDGTMLDARNIFAQFNPEAGERVLLLAHYDCRPWADEDPDPTKHRQPVDGANDGASGVGVLLEIARLISQSETAPAYGVDILFLDAEDWGNHNDDESWAMGAKYFARNPVVEGYSPSRAILLDMVGSKDATFYKEYFSEEAAPDLNREIWSIAADAGYDHLFKARIGSAVTDDHRALIDVGIPAIDIIDYRMDASGGGFDPVWHTTSDTMANISPATLGAVGQTLARYLWK